MRRVLVTLTLCAAMANLGGCVLALGNGVGDGDSTWDSSSHHDTTLAKAIRTGLDADPATHEADLSVATADGRVYLSGTVHAPETLEKAVQIALANPDTTSVHCHINVIR
ncbi:MAG TPA: BON domain-containing protein [Gammaproteobacteria bacterium]|jgi:osmotically-inducible protein OsmY